jgi:hypothetical protein
MLLADVGDSVQRGFNEFAQWVPHLVGFFAVLIIGYFVAKILGSVVRKLLQRAGLDSWSLRGQSGRWVSKVTSSPSNLLGRVTFWVVMLAAISLAVSVLGIQALEDFVAAIYAYIPNVIAALLIFLVAGAIAGGIAALAQRTMGDTPTGKILATVAPALVMAIAIFMILVQLQIAKEIVIITYAALIGALALGSALAFGLGGRDVAARMLESAYATGQANRAQVRRDFQQGRERARMEAERMRSETGVVAEGDTVASPYQTGATTGTEDVSFQPSEQLTRDINRPRER